MFSPGLLRRGKGPNLELRQQAGEGGGSSTKPRESTRRVGSKQIKASGAEGGGGGSGAFYLQQLRPVAVKQGAQSGAALPRRGQVAHGHAAVSRRPPPTPRQELVGLGQRLFWERHGHGHARPLRGEEPRKSSGELRCAHPPSTAALPGARPFPSSLPCPSSVSPGREADRVNTLHGASRIWRGAGRTWSGVTLGQTLT